VVDSEGLGHRNTEAIQVLKNHPGSFLTAFLLCMTAMLASPALAQDCDEIYDPSQVLSLYITMDPQDWETVRFSCPWGQCGPKPYTYYRALLRCGNGGTIEVGIRRKSGNAEPDPWNPQKPPLKIDVNRYLSEQEFAGKSKLSLENGAGDTLISEGLAWQIYQSAGVVASRAAWVNVYVNGQHKGLYINVEQIDKTFLTDHGVDNGGWLFKREDQRTRELEENPFAFNWYPFDHALRPEETPTPPDWREQAAWRVNMPNLLTLAALENFIANLDGFFGGRHNYWYYDWAVFPEGQQPRLYFAWDLDFPFRAVDINRPILGTRNGHLRQGIIAEDVEFQMQYLGIYGDLLTGPLSLSQTSALVDSLEPLLTPSIEADPYHSLGPASFAFDGVRNYLQGRTLNLLNQLSTCPDDICSPGETSCTCAADCGPISFSETGCADSIDGDCDGFVDCGDGDCADDPVCSAVPLTNGIRVSEVLANTSGSPDVEYIEIYNAGPAAQDLTGWYLLDDDNTHDRCFLEGALDPGQRLVVAGDIELFTEVWEVPYLNPNSFDDGTGFSLGNQGDQVRLFRPTPLGDEAVHGMTLGIQGAEVPFGDPLPGADAPEYLSLSTPGVTNETAVVHSPVCINEFLTTSQGGGVDDWIELYNRGPATVDIGGWSLSDKVQNPTKYVFPPGTSIHPGEYLTLDENTLGFGLSSTGSEVIMLTHADGVTGQDYFDYGLQFPDVSRGRFPDGGHGWHFFTAPSPGQPNACFEPPLDAVDGLKFLSSNLFFWDLIAGAEAYDVVKGDLQLLHATAGDLTSVVTGCQWNNAESGPWWDDESPTPGNGIFFLVRAVDGACGLGSYDSGSVSQIAPRDAAIEAAPSTCP